MRRALLLALAPALLAAAAPRARARLTDPVITAPSALCTQAIAQAERGHNFPPGLLAAIARVESGRRDPLTGALLPWPWTVDVEGEGHFYATEADAIDAVRGFQRQGRFSIDVGCLQVNLHQHPDAFASLEQAFDPISNATYAAGFLDSLHAPGTDWLRAAGLYHSATPALAAPYRVRVAQQLGVPDAQGFGPPGFGAPFAGQLLAALAPPRPFGAAARALHAFAPPARPQSFSPPMPGNLRLARAPGLPPAPAAPGLPGARSLAAYRLAPIRRRA